MKKSLLFFMFLFIIITFNYKIGFSQDESSSKIGTVDLVTVFALHPKMIYYDKEIGRFLKPANINIKYDDCYNYIEKQKIEMKKLQQSKNNEIKSILDEIQKLKDEIKEQEINLIKSCEPIHKKYEQLIMNTTSESAIKKILSEKLNEITKITDKSKKNIELKYEKIQKLKSKYQNILESLLNVYYLTPEETNKQFEEISKEIKEAIKVAAINNGIDIVVNRNLESTQVSDNMSNLKDDPQTLDEKNQLMEKLQELMEISPNSETFSKRLKNIEELNIQNFSEIISERNNITSRESQMAIKPFFNEGKDLTWFTVIWLFMKNGISKEKAEAVSEVLTELYGKY